MTFQIIFSAFKNSAFCSNFVNQAKQAWKRNERKELESYAEKQ